MTMLSRLKSSRAFQLTALLLLLDVAVAPTLHTSYGSGLVAAGAGQSAVAASTEISAQRIKQHVEYLASDELQGRRAGTPFADKAAKYIESKFRESGLSPAGPSGFLQPFAFVSDVLLGRDNLFRVKWSTSERSLQAGQDFLPLAFSSPRLAQGPVIFAGYGISAPELQYDDYTGLDVAGKVVLIMRGGPDGDNPHGRFADYTAPGRELQFKTLKAKEKGAGAVVFVGDQKSFSAKADSSLHYDLNFLDSGIPAVYLGRDACQSILAGIGVKLEDLENKQNVGALNGKGLTFEIRTAAEKIEGATSNVVGMIRGSDPVLGSEYIIIGAHYDHLGMGGPESLAQNPYGQIHHGADDNASGSAALMELARVLAQDKAHLRRSVIFAAFSGEEEGLLGSAAYTRNPPVPLSSTVAMINMDMVGRLRDHNLVVGGAGTSPAWKPLLNKLNQETPQHSDPAKSVGRFNLSLEDDGYGPSDHQSFYVRDIPVLFFFTGSHDDYHKPSDTADRVDSAGIALVAQFIREIVVPLAGADEPIAFTKVKRDTRQTTGGFRVYLGTVPNYSEQTDGLKLDGVRPGSPAERAGLKAGDIVVKLGKTAVKNVYDYTYALEGLRAGEETEMDIRRDGQLITLKITPEKRN
jgi:aminopeptidase YwaD